MRLAPLAGLALAALPGPAAACRLALLLALDVSSSVDADEDRLQREGLAAALVAPEVVAAFLDDPYAPVALAAFEWSGTHKQQVVLPWRLIGSEEDLTQAGAELVASVRSESEFPTAIGYAMGYASILFRDAPACLRRTIDVSGDGANNDGFPPRMAYRHFPLEDVTVNVLAIGSADELAALVPYYEAEVIKGPGAFVEAAEGYGDYARAMRRKLEREVASRVVGVLADRP